MTNLPESNNDIISYTVSKLSHAYHGIQINDHDGL